MMNNSITIEEFKIIKQDSEARLASLIQKELSEFAKKTGYSPKGVYISMVDITNIGDPRKEYFISRCNIEVDL